MFVTGHSRRVTVAGARWPVHGCNHAGGCQGVQRRGVVDGGGQQWAAGGSSGQMSDTGVRLPTVPPPGAFARPISKAVAEMYSEKLKIPRGDFKGCQGCKRGRPMNFFCLFTLDGERVCGTYSACREVAFKRGNRQRFEGAPIKTEPGSEHNGKDTRSSRDPAPPICPCVREHILGRLPTQEQGGKLVPTLVPLESGATPILLDGMIEKLGAALLPTGAQTTASPHAHTKRPADAAPEERPAKQRDVTSVVPPPNISTSLSKKLQRDMEVAYKEKNDVEQRLAEQNKLVHELQKKLVASETMASMHDDAAKSDAARRAKEKDAARRVEQVRVSTAAAQALTDSKQRFIKSDGMNLRFVLDTERDKRLCEMAVNENALALQHVPEKHKTLQLCLKAVAQRGYALQYVAEEQKHKTPDLCLKAVAQYGNALQYVPEELKSPDLCKAAVGSDGLALVHVPDKHKTKDVCTVAVKQNGRAIERVPSDLQRDLYETAVKQDGMVLQLIPEDDRTTAICQVAVQHGPMALEHVPDKTAEICMAAVGAWGFALRYVPEEHKSPDICMAAVRITGEAIAYVPDEHCTIELCETAVRQIARKTSVSLLQAMQKVASSFPTVITGQLLKRFRNEDDPLRKTQSDTTPFVPL